MTQKKAIVTGASGYIGSNLCRVLIKQGWDVTIIIRNTSSMKLLEDISDFLNIYTHSGDTIDLITLFKNVKPYVVFHLASLTLVEHKPSEIIKLTESNILFGLEILEAMKESGTKLLINTGTFWQNLNGQLYNPVNLYAATKEAFENLIKYYIEAEGFRVVTLKLFDTYGETDVRPKLLNLLKQFSEQQNELNMSPGEQQIDLVYISDVVNAYIKAFEYLNESKQVTNEVFGVGSREIIKLKELVKLFEEILGKKIHVNFGGKEYRKREVMELWKDYQTVPGWKCEVTLKEGLLKFK